MTFLIVSLGSGRLDHRVTTEWQSTKPGDRSHIARCDRSHELAEEGNAIQLEFFPNSNQRLTRSSLTAPSTRVFLKKSGFIPAHRCAGFANTKSRKSASEIWPCSTIS